VGKETHTPASAAAGIEHAFRMLEGRWKLVILFHLFGGRTLRFSDLERAIRGVSQKMLAQQLRQLERDGIVTRTVHPEVPPRVEYRLTDWGQSLCPALDQLLTWAEARPVVGSGSARANIAEKVGVMETAREFLERRTDQAKPKDLLKYTRKARRERPAESDRR
jgi:DNA-binding HxlR family transcriptional regulator